MKYAARVPIFSVLFFSPLVVFVVIGLLIKNGIINVPPPVETAPPEPDADNSEPPLPDDVHTVPAVSAPSSPHDILYSVDSMSGYDFEHWCAELLRRLAFSSVEVTQVSRDQGVDVLAVKGGVRYAIQCKCYSADIGNHAVQEVKSTLGRVCITAMLA